MSIPITQINFDLHLNREASLDFRLCQVISMGHSQALEACLIRGFCPNYILQEDVVVNDCSFSRGSCLLSIICQCCSVVYHPWNCIGMINSLLNKGVDLENSPGGGYTSALDYVCVNEDCIFGEVIITLLKNVSRERAEKALCQISSISRRRELLREITGSSQFTIFNSSEINQSILQGNESKLKELLDAGLDSNYVLEEDIFVGENGLLPKGISMLLAVLILITLKKGDENSILQLLEILALLLERGASLEEEYYGTCVLDYACEHENKIPRDIVLCLLGSVSLNKALLALDRVGDSSVKESLERDLRLNTPLFSSEEYGIENVFREIFQNSSRVSSQLHRPYVKTKYELSDDE